MSQNQTLYVSDTNALRGHASEVKQSKKPCSVIFEYASNACG
jgi:hypothetical protein